MRREGEMTTIEERTPQGKERSRRGIWLTAVVAVLLLGGLLALGYWPRATQARKLAATTQANQRTLPVVSIVVVKQAPAEVDLELPGNVQALTEAVVFARADGYVKRRLADIGDRVKSGQLLAEVESPELDQQIREAQATLEARTIEPTTGPSRARPVQSESGVGGGDGTAVANAGDQRRAVQAGWRRKAIGLGRPDGRRGGG